MAPPKAVLFDVDGTLIDTVDLHARAWVEALQHFSVEATFEDMRLQIGKGGDQLLKGLLPPGTIEAREHEIQEFRTELFKREYMPQARAFPGVRDLFERIRTRGQRIVLASSGKADEVKAYLASVGVLCGGFAQGALRAAGCIALYRDPQHLAEAYDTSPLAMGLTAAGQASAQEHGS